MSKKKQPEITRIDRAVMALHDHGTRDKATMKSVMRGMKADGFTEEEIVAAAERMK